MKQTFCVHKGRFNKLMAEAERNYGFNSQSIIDAKETKGKFKRGYFGCADKKGQRILINLPLLYEFIPLNEPGMIDMIQSTIEHETLHHILWDFEILNTGEHHEIIPRITDDDRRKFFYHYHNPVFKEEGLIWWLTHPDHLQ